jgi:hypothetical protein
MVALEFAAGPDHPDVAIDLSNLAELLAATNRLSEAEPLLRRALAMAWLRQPAGAPSARNLLDHVARLQALRQVGLPAEIGRTVHQNHLLRLAREGAQTTVYHLRDFEVQRR